MLSEKDFKTKIFLKDGRILSDSLMGKGTYSWAYDLGPIWLKEGKYPLLQIAI